MDFVSLVISIIALLTAIAFIYIAVNVKKKKYKLRFVCCVFIFIVVGSIPFMSIYNRPTIINQIVQPTYTPKLI